MVASTHSSWTRPMLGATGTTSQSKNRKMSWQLWDMQLAVSSSRPALDTAIKGSSMCAIKPDFVSALAARSSLHLTQAFATKKTQSDHCRQSFCFSIMYTTMLCCHDLQSAAVGPEGLGFSRLPNPFSLGRLPCKCPAV